MRRRGLLWVGAVVLLLTGCDAGSSSSSPEAAAPAVTTVHTPFRRPDPQADPSTVVDTASDTLPSGARAARLCLHDNNVAWIPPRGLLTTGLDDLVELVNVQKVHDPKSGLGCGGVGAPAWSIVLRYDGGTRTITGDNGGCWDLLVGSTERFGSRDVYDAFLGAMLRQRHAEPLPEAAYPRLTCPDHVRTDDAFSPLADAARLASAQVCGTDGGTVARATSLSHAQLLALRHDTATASAGRTGHDLDGPCFQRGPQLEGVVVGRDRWGDPVTLLVECNSYRMIRPGSDRYVFARMLPSTERMLRVALDG